MQDFWQKKLSKPAYVWFCLLKRLAFAQKCERNFGGNPLAGGPKYKFMRAFFHKNSPENLHISKILCNFAAQNHLVTDEMSSTKNILSQIQTLGKKVLPTGSSLMLYGSRARGDNREDSDYDLVVLVDKDKQQLQDFTDYAYPFMEMGWELGAEINPMLYTRKEWSQRHFTPFYKNVEHDKIVLV